MNVAYMISLLKHGSHDQRTHAHSSGATAMHANLSPKIDAINAQIDGVPSNPTIAGDLVQAKVTLHAASIAPTPLASAQGLMNTRLALSNAARKVTGSNTPLAIKLGDISKDVKLLEAALQRP
jgi:hypothetical protein